MQANGNSPKPSKAADPGSGTAVTAGTAEPDTGCGSGATMGPGAGISNPRGACRGDTQSR